ncbi:MAG TPA: type II secretion system protein GspG [Candidatus Polarisedimenticolia bacterium]|nr:type II secretion system protein GspG [Candidatus Polarisedimenticolia bacterium]
MKSIALLSLAALLFTTGCKPSGGSQSPTSTNSSGSVLQAPADYVGALGAAKQNAGKTADIASLNQAIQMFQVDKGRFPKDLNELVQEKYIGKVPDAPYGMKIDYDPATGTVKVVNQ